MFSPCPQGKIRLKWAHKRVEGKPYGVGASRGSCLGFVHALTKEQLKANRSAKQQDAAEFARR